MDIVIIDVKRNLSQWEDSVAPHPQGFNYHQVGWKTVIEQNFGHQTRYLMATDGGVMVGILPLGVLKRRLFGRSLISLPFLNYGGLLASTGLAKEAVVSAASGLATDEGAQYVELRLWEAQGLGLVPKQHKVTMLLPLDSDAEIQWKHFNAKVRNQIQQG